MFDLDAIQESLRSFGLDAWLLYDFRGNNLLARRVLDLDGKAPGSRRFFYMIPAWGEPRKLVHRIETAALDHLPGSKQVYLRWQELEEKVSGLVEGCRRIAMEYAPRLMNPYVARIDAGVAEFVRSLGVEIVSSGDLVQLFESTWDEQQWRQHLEAERHTQSAFDVAWGLIADRVRRGSTVRETEVQKAILDHFERHNLTTYSPPNVSVGPHSGDPHYEPVPGHDAEIGPDDFVLIDLWAKVKAERSVYSDLTRVGYVGESVPARYEEIFAIVARARDAAIAIVRDAFAAGRPIQGWEVDDAARDVIEAAGYGANYIHRTGHNIGQEVHGNGAHMDNLETHEERLILPMTCFSVEPGIYFDDFGIRSEINVFVDAEKNVHVTGGLQERVVPILAMNRS
ncbi:MAG: hypothetical protein ABS79_01600 [Planctomycetes bacterium SCN 63-9]|nr:MAG: hypothetical protein ABS79_01600 [Planctomycetes bacterium SCN 63-9]